MNGDGEINIGDFNYLMDVILANGNHPDMWDGKYYVEGFLGRGPTGQVVLFPKAFCRGDSFDLNDDGEVNIADANYLIDIMLGN